MDEKERGEGQNGRATRARPEHYHEPSHLFLLGYGESVEIVSPELHEPHVGGLGEFGDDVGLGEEPEDGLHAHDGVAVSQRVLLRRVGRLLVDHHHVLCGVDACSQQVVKAEE